MGTRIRWAFHATDHSKIGTIEEVATDDVPWLIQCGNAVLADEEPEPAAQPALDEDPGDTEPPAEKPDEAPEATLPGIPRQRNPRA